MGLFEERRRLEQEDGEPLHTLRVMPDTEAAQRCQGAGVVVVTAGDPEAARERLVLPLAELGYFVVAIDLLRDRGTLDPETAIADLATALLYLRELAGGRLGVIGLDAAAGLAIEAATRLPQLDSVVVSGGAAPPKGVKLARSRSSILILRGTRTSPLTDAHCLELARRIEPAMQRVIVRDFPCADGFWLRPTEAERDHATEAFDHATSFLAQTLLRG